MVQPIDVLVSAFMEGAKQFTTYFALGSSAAVSALLLDNKLAPAYSAATRVIRGESRAENEPDLDGLADENTVKSPILLGEVRASTARWILVGLTFVAGIMAAAALDALIRTLVNLASEPQLKAALCLYPSLATSGRTLAYASAALPGLILGFIAWRDGQRVRALSPRESGAPLIMAYVFAIPYLVIAASIHRLPC